MTDSVRRFPQGPKNPDLPEDKEIAAKFIAAMDTVVKVMNEADQMGISCGFGGINRKPNGKFAVVNLTVSKSLTEGKDNG